MPQFDLAHFPSQIFWLLITFSFLYIVVRWVILNKIRESLIHRKDVLDGWLEEASQLRDHAEKTSSEYEERIRKARQDIQKQLTESLNELKERQMVAEKESMDRMEQESNKAHEQLQKLWLSWEGEIESMSNQLASDILVKITAKPSAKSKSY